MDGECKHKAHKCCTHAELGKGVVHETEKWHCSKVCGYYLKHK